MGSQPCAPRDLREEFARHGRIHGRLPGRRSLDRCRQAFQRAVFEDVACGAAADGVEDPFVGVIGRQHQDPHPWVLLADLPRGLDAVHARHLQVHEHHVGLGRGQEGQGLVPVARLADDLDSGDLVQDDPESLADDLLIV